MMLKRATLKQKARKRLKGRCVRAYLTTLPLCIAVYLPILYCLIEIWVPALRDLRGVFARTPQYSILRDAGTRALLQSIPIVLYWLAVAGPAALSMRRYYLRLRRNRNRFDALGCFRSYRRFLAANAWFTLWRCMQFLPAAAFLFAYVSLHSHSFWEFPTSSGALVSLVCAGICGLWAVWRVLRYVLAPYILLDQKDASAREVLTASKALMQSRCLDHMALTASFLPFWLLSLATFGLAYVYALPYRMMADAVFYGAARRAANQVCQEEEAVDMPDPLPCYTLVPGES